jgi:hypothetical protein
MIEMMAEGYFNSWMAAEWGISEDTFYLWRKDHEEFEEAYARGMAVRTVWWEKKGMEMMANGDNKGFNYWIAFMNRHHNWKPQSETSSNATTVNIQTMNVLATKSKEDLVELIQIKLKALDMLPGTAVQQIDYQEIDNESGEPI